MNSSNSRPRIVGRNVPTVTGNRHRSIYDPRTHDEHGHAINMLMDARYVIVNQDNPRKNLPMLTDRRMLIPLAIPTAPGVTFSRWHVKEHHADYILCRSWNGSKEGTKDVKIAKPPELRCSILSALLPDGTTLTFDTFDLTAQSRHASGDDGSDEDEFITPRYYIADEITNKDYWIEAATTNTLAFDEDGKAIGLMDQNRAGRAWAAP